ncbi:MAG: hypothetical protein NC452_04970 [Eubacterium sp.]|nr:hypothetical protein [Eubacterium sp.]
MMEEENIQYILNENKELEAMPKAEAKPVEYPVKYKLKNAFEVFVRVKGTENYCISNYGRCINNLNHKDKNTFYQHKTGDHYTIFEIEQKEVLLTQKGKPTKRRSKYSQTKIVENRYKRETSAGKLVAETFLVQYDRRTAVWHKDGDKYNNWYKNLIMVTPYDYKKLHKGEITWQELNLEQEYIEYENKANSNAYRVYNGIKARCKDTKNDDYIPKCYDEVTMCQEWKDNPKSFVKWYLEHYYTVDDEEMNVDKDLFTDGDTKIYSPETCCILPKSLNALLTNCKKHYREGTNEENTLPYGVNYSVKKKKYYSDIQFTGTEKTIRLSEWDTAEEAFKEYKMMKQADMLIVAAKYKGKIPDYIYNKILEVEIKPY